MAEIRYDPLPLQDPTRLSPLGRAYAGFPSVTRRQSPIDMLREAARTEIGEYQSPEDLRARQELQFGGYPLREPYAQHLPLFGFETDPIGTVAPRPSRSGMSMLLPLANNPPTPVQDALNPVVDALKKLGQQQMSAGQDQPRTLSGRSIFHDYLHEPADDQQDEAILKSAYARRMQEYLEPYQQEMDRLSGQYGDRIGELEKELAGYRGGLVQTNAAYSEYADDADAILKEAASVQAKALPESGVPETVAATYDEFDGELQSTFLKMEANGNEALAQAMSAEVRRMEGVVTDGLRSELMSQDDMHRLAGSQAQALAHMAWKDDAYQAEKSRFQLELQINTAMDQKAKEIADTRKQMADALQAVRDQMADFDMSPEELWDAALTDFGMAKGLNAWEVDELRQTWIWLMDNPANEANYGSFKESLMFAVNQQAMMELGVADEIAAWTTRMTEAGMVDSVTTLNQMMTSMNVKDLIGGINRLVGQMGGSPLIPTDIDVADATSSSSAMYDSLLDLWGHYGDFKTNYDSYRSSAALTQSKGSSAPLNWQNRYQPEYRFRREQWAPQFAQLFENTFAGVAGLDVGGLKYMRPPTDVSASKAANSDHQSGGALDLYAKNHEDMLKIEAWARAQPGVSYVIYSGNKHHEGHHVHVSLQLGYGFRG